MSSAVVLPDLELILSDLALYLIFYILFYYVSVDANRAHKIPPSPNVHPQYFSLSSGNSFRNRYALLPLSIFITFEGEGLGRTDTYR